MINWEKSSMKIENYYPNSKIFEKIIISEELNDIIELIAESIHDTWAINRIEKGWTYGKERDDILKHHPCLIPYDQLSDEEKTFDRKTAQVTIKTLINLGFVISKNK
jgi:ryanodine receptor 2